MQLNHAKGLAHTINVERRAQDLDQPLGSELIDFEIEVRGT